MSSRIFAVVVLAALPQVSACDDLRCGPGTVERAQADGSRSCEAVDAPAASIDCETDAGMVEIVGGHCVSAVHCDAQTAQYDPKSGLCVGVAATSACPPCTPPDPNSICVSGQLYDFTSGMKVMPGGRPLRMALYEPLSFLSNPSSVPLGEDASSTKGCYTLTVPAPSSGLVALAVGNPAGTTRATPLVLAGTGAATTKGQAYKLDGYVVPKSLVDGWSGASGIDYAGQGAFVGCFYGDPVPAAQSAQVSETMPLAGVKILANGAAPADAHYLASDRSFDPALSATGPLGCALVPGSGGINTFSGQGGGPMKWEKQPGSSTTGVAFIGRFHSCDASPSAASCM